MPTVADTTVLATNDGDIVRAPPQFFLLIYIVDTMVSYAEAIETIGVLPLMHPELNFLVGF